MLEKKDALSVNRENSMSPKNKRAYLSNLEDRVHLKIGNSNFLDKILNQYENVNVPLSMDQTIEQRLRSRSINQRAQVSRKKKKNLTKPRSNERECAFLNDATLDTVEIKKIDEAIANMSPPLVEKDNEI